MNNTETRDTADAKLTQPSSLIVLARQLTRSPGVPRQLASLLLQQTYNYDANPEAMGPRILATIERIQAAA